MGLARTVVSVLVASSTSVVLGCADPTFGERLQAEGQTLTQAGEDHDEGVRLVQEGESKLRRARGDESEAQAMIEEGRKLMRNAESVAAAR